MAKSKDNKSTETVEEVSTNTGSAPKLDFESFFDKNKNLFTIFLAVLFIGAAGWAGYNYYTTSQDDEAQKEMFVAVNYFELDSLDLALNGDKVNRGFIEISEAFSMSKSGNLSNFYIGVIYLKKGKFDESIEYLKKFSSSDILIQARAYSLIGDAYIELKDLNNAISYYKKATEYKPNEFFTPRYLIKLGMAQEANGDYASAITAYSSIIDNFGKAQEVNDAKKYKARAEELGKE